MDLSQALAAAAAAMVMALHGVGVTPADAAHRLAALASEGIQSGALSEAIVALLQEESEQPCAEKQEPLRAGAHRFVPDVRWPIERL
jgi:hypothetical protein